MTLLADTGAAPQTAHASLASRAGVVRERLRINLARLSYGRSSVAAWLRVARGRVAARLLPPQRDPPRGRRRAEMRQRYGSPERAKREIFARYASFVYLGNGRYGFASG
jgi:hypothetical protein